MNLKIKHKLFLVLVSASIMIIAGMFLFTRLSFERGLIRYVDTMESRYLETMASVLEEHYALEKNWEFLKNDPEALREIRHFMFRKWRSEAGGCDREMMQKGIRHGRRPAPFMEPMRGMHRKNPEHMRELVLLGPDRELLSGERKPAGDIKSVPVVYNGKAVGFLALSEPRMHVENEELSFFRDQNRTFLIIAFSMVLVAVLVAVWTAYFLEGPVKTLTDGTRKLASGLYKTRIPVKSGDELGRLSRDFNVLAETLEKNEHDRKKWVEDIAHELRTPLTLLSGELEAVEDGVRNFDYDTLRRLKNDIDHLIRLVNDLNELSRTDIGALTYKKEVTDLVSVLKNIFKRFYEPLHETGLRFEDRISEKLKVHVFADPDRLSQLFVNLLKNSMDYTRKGGFVAVDIDISDKMVFVTVEDSEPGVPEDALPELFNRLYRLENSRNRKYGGSGLGLAICKNIVEAHDGTIKAEHSSSGGILIRVGLPIYGDMK